MNTIACQHAALARALWIFVSFNMAFLNYPSHRYALLVIDQAVFAA